MSGVTSIAIRPMRPEDAARVAELTTELGYPSTEDEIRRRYGLIINRPDASLFVAHDARNVVVGWIHVQATHLLECDARAEIWGLVVGEIARGTGVGRRLVEAAEEWALRRGLRAMAVAIEPAPDRGTGLLRASRIQVGKNTKRLQEDAEAL